MQLYPRWKGDEKKEKKNRRTLSEGCVCGSDGRECSSPRRGYFHSLIVFLPREENPVRASFACRNETAVSLRHPPTQSVIGIPSYHCADESHSPEMGFPRRLPCPLYCLLASSVRSLQHYENKAYKCRNWKGQEPSQQVSRREDAGLKQDLKKEIGNVKMASDRDGWWEGFFCSFATNRRQK